MMKAAVLTGIEHLEIREFTKPSIEKSNEVLLKVDAVGVCGSDIHYYKTGRIGKQIINYPFTIGHEFVATVSEIGTKVTRVKPGDVVTVDPAISCGICDQCLQGRRHTCRNLKFMGNPGEHSGCLSEYVVLPEDRCYSLNKDFNALEGVLVEPLAIANYAVKFIDKIDVGTVGILGTGPIGLSVQLNLRTIDVEKIYVTDKLDYRIEKAKDLGTVWGGNPDKVDIVSEVTKAEPLLLDVVFECCGQQDAINQAIRILKPGGHLIIVGIPEVDEISFDIHNLRRKEITIHNVRRQNECTNSAIDFIANNRDVSKLVTHKYNFNEIVEAFELVAGYKDGVIKAVILFN
jgi:L-iditol 2-dehydrogenase